MSVSPQARASLAVKYNLTLDTVVQKLTGFLKKLGMFLFVVLVILLTPSLRDQHGWLKLPRSLVYAVHT